MPWIKDVNGDDKYIPSIYAKEELPTWIEMYEEFWMKKIFKYDKENPNDAELDIYWNIPRKKFIMATACNQLNKMLMENPEFHDKVIDHIHSTNKDSCLKSGIENIYFVMLKSDNMNDDFDDLPVIFTFPHPKGIKNPFILSDTPRIDISDDSSYTMSLVIRGLFNLRMFNNSKVFLSTLEFMMKDIIDYFEGEGIGWKDENGHLLENKKDEIGCNGSGFDPAL